MIIFKTILIIYTFLFISCGVDKNTQFQLDGIYKITTYEKNDNSCEEKGKSHIDKLNEKYLYSIRSSFFGITLLNIYSCSSPDQCETDKRNKKEQLSSKEINFSPINNELSFNFQLFSENSALGIITTSSKLSTDPLKCSGELIEVEITRSDENIQITETKQKVEYNKLNADGFCDLDEAKKLAKLEPCFSQVYIEAESIE